MKKIKVVCFCYEDPQDVLWFTVSVDDNNNIVYSKDLNGPEEIIGEGHVNYAHEGRGFRFNLYWLDDGIAGLDWTDCDDPAAEINILDRRIALGEVFNFIEGGNSSEYRITDIQQLGCEPA